MPREGPALIGQAACGWGGFVLRIEPGLDAVAHDLVQPALESIGTDLVEPIRLDLLAVVRLEEPVDDDARFPGVDDRADLADLVEGEDRVLLDPAELVARHPAELAAVGGGLGVLAVLLGQLGEGVGVVLELRGDVLRLGLRALALAGLLDHVPAEVGPNRLADLSDLELREGGRELGHVRRVLRIGPAEVAAAGPRAGVVAVLVRDRVPVGVVGLEHSLDLLGLGLGRRPLLVGGLRLVLEARVGGDEDVPRSHLRDRECR